MTLHCFKEGSQIIGCQWDHLSTSNVDTNDEYIYVLSEQGTHIGIVNDLKISKMQAVTS
jgi:hypothetical protein